MIKIKCRTIFAGMLAALCAILTFQPASADTLSNIKPLGIGSNGIDHSNLPISSVSSYSGGVAFQVYGYGGNTSPKDIYLGLQNLTTIPANSLVYVTMSVTGSNTNDAPLCFTGGWNHEVIDCDINGDNGNYTVSGLFYVANSRTSIALYNYVRNDNLYYAASAPYISIVGYQATINQSLTADDISAIKGYIDGLEGGLSSIGTDVARIKNLVDWTNNDVFAIRGMVEDMQESQQAQQQAEQNATDNIENQTTSDSSYSESTNQQTTSLINAFGGFVSAIGNIQATSCDLSLPLPNFMGGTRIVNACTAKSDGGNDVITIINVASSIMAIIFYIPFALMMINLIYKEIRSFTN